MNILGLNAYHADAAAALLSGGDLLCAIEEERLRRIKHWAGFPSQAAAACLAYAKDGGRGALDAVAISRDPRANIGGKLRHVASHPRSALHAVSRTKNSVKVLRLGEELAALGLPNVPVHYVEHHRAHLASAFFVSPFEEAAVVSLDGFGDFRSLMWGTGSGNRMDVRGAVSFPHSLGQFYTGFTQYLGFPGYGDEYKMMGLAAYGKPNFLEQVRRVVKVSADQIRLNLAYFTHHTSGTPMTWEGGYPHLGSSFSRKMAEVFGPAREPGTPLEERHADIAASVQAVLEECYVSLLRYVQAQTGLKSVCLAGGVALNCAVNGKILEHTPFEKVFVQPAANDSGTSLGAALYVWHQTMGKPRSFTMNHAYYGPEYSEADIREVLDAAGLRYTSLTEDRLVEATAAHLASGKIVGWFQGRMEFGPRALGNRSILADPRRAEMVDTLNRRIKFRETFRPYCPSVLVEAAEEYFEPGWASPFMVSACPVRPVHRLRIPAVVHADGTGRLQLVEQSANPLYWKLLRSFERKSGVPVLINTSFNENEPVVNTPQEALDCFLRTEMDILALGRNVLVKEQVAQPELAAAARGER
jgi:carbamoyltransferase